ncbi:spectrin-like nuclear envelope [Schistosoma japonicum]|uniref:Spectrin-like nuclear envelope n=1 Tax=Schistosoma japonicum TaxID=6182 RepID=A0A4Z2CZ63_SCHJA|nr:spectrin-like nuclear envelope [Schistosoma japonicum]
MTRQSTLINNIELEIKWLHDLEEEINQDHISKNNSQFITEVTLSIQDEINHYNQLLYNLNLHSQHIDEHCYPNAYSLNDSITLKQIDNLKSKFNVIKQNLNKIINNKNEQMKLIHTLQYNLDNFKMILKNFNDQLNSIIEIQLINDVNIEIDNQLLETTYMNMKIQIEVSSINEYQFLNDYKNLLNQIQNDLTTKQLQFNQLIEINHNNNNLLLFKQQFLQNNILKNYNKQFEDKKSLLKQKINELIEKCKYFINFEKNSLDNLNKLKCKLNDIKQSINILLIENSINIDYEQQLNTINESLLIINNQYKIICENIKEININKIDKLFNECNELINDKLLTLKINKTFDQLKNQQKSIKSKLIDDLQLIKNNQLMNLLNEFKLLKQSVNQLIIKSQMNIQFKFIDDKFINESIHRIEQSIEILCNQLNDNLLQYKTIINNECQLLKLYENINDWILNYENELLNIENNITNITQSNTSNNLQSIQSINKIIENNLHTINNLKIKYSHGEKLYELLMNKCNEYHELMDTTELNELHNRLITLNTQQLHNIETNLLNIKDNLNNLTNKNKNIDEELLKYEEIIDKLKQFYYFIKI